MEERKKEKIKKPPTKQVHLECDMALYNKFEEYCYRNGKREEWKNYNSCK